MIDIGTFGVSTGSGQEPLLYCFLRVRGRSRLTRVGALHPSKIVQKLPRYSREQSVLSKPVFCIPSISRMVEHPDNYGSSRWGYGAVLFAVFFRAKPQ